MDQIKAKWFFHLYLQACLGSLFERCSENVGDVLTNSKWTWILSCCKRQDPTESRLSRLVLRAGKKHDSSFQGPDCLPHVSWHRILKERLFFFFSQLCTFLLHSLFCVHSVFWIFTEMNTLWVHILVFVVSSNFTTVCFFTCSWVALILWQQEQSQ